MFYCTRFYSCSVQVNFQRNRREKAKKYKLTKIISFCLNLFPNSSFRRLHDIQKIIFDWNNHITMPRKESIRQSWLSQSPTQLFETGFGRRCSLHIYCCWFSLQFNLFSYKKKFFGLTIETIFVSTKLIEIKKEIRSEINRKKCTFSCYEYNEEAMKKSEKKNKSQQIDSLFIIR